MSATYWSADVGNEGPADVAWSSEPPNWECRAVGGHLSLDEAGIIVEVALPEWSGRRQAVEA